MTLRELVKLYRLFLAERFMRLALQVVPGDTAEAVYMAQAFRQYVLRTHPGIEDREKQG